MKILITIVVILLSLVLIYFLYTTIRDLLFPEIGIYKSNLFSFKAFYHHWKDNNPSAEVEEFPMREALVKTLYTRYPNWTLEQKTDFIKKNNITSIGDLIYEIAKNELSSNDFEKYKKRYGEREQ